MRILTKSLIPSQPKLGEILNMINFLKYALAILMARILVGIFILFSLLMSPQQILAHGIGQSFTLPIPLSFYLWGAGATVLISFIIVSYFVGSKKKRQKNKAKKNLTLFKVPKLIQIFLKFLSVFLFALVIISGIFGNQDPRFNLAPTFIWAFFVIFFVVTSAIFGNWWHFLNPLKIIFSIYEKIAGSAASLNFKYPIFLRSWPAVFFYFAFIWLELVSGFSDQPQILSFFIIFYSLVIFWGMILFDKNTWLNRADFFTVLARLLSYLSPFDFRKSTLILTNPIEKIIKAQGINSSYVAFILLTLAGVAFDSFGESAAFFSLINLFNLENSSIGLTRTIGLALMILPFLILYLVFSTLGKIISKTKHSISFFVNKFALSLLPISLAYFIAHFYTLLLTQGQSLIYLISDPLGIGWNIFGTSKFKINAGILDAGFVWYSQVVLIILGHIGAIYLAHLISLEIFKNKNRTMLSQYPMTTLMIIYTIFSLWLLAQPIVISPQ